MNVTHIKGSVKDAVPENCWFTQQKLETKTPFYEYATADNK
jgi:hypothetical protein